MRKKRVVITGIGPVANIGIGKKDFWKGILDKKIFIKKVKDGKMPVESYFAYKVDNFNIRDFVSEDILQDIKLWKEGKENTDLYYSMAALKLALEDSGLEYKKEDNDIGVVFTNENPGVGEYTSQVINIAYRFIKRKKEIKKKDFVREWIKLFDKPTYELQTFMPLYHLTKAFGLRGYSLFINNACASGLYAIECASQIIKTERCSAVIVVASDVCDVFKYLWFKDLKLYAPDGLIKPFSNKGNGLVIGEGGAAIVMEDFEFATRRKAHIYAEYIGGSFLLEGWKITLPAIWSDFYERVIKDCLLSSRIAKDKVDLINAHGVGMSMIDKYEIKAIESVFGKNSNQPLIAAFKPYIGHTLGLNALLEVIILLLALETNIIPPTLNFSPLISEINIVKRRLKKELRYVMKIVCAFAGYLGACLFKKI